MLTPDPNVKRRRKFRPRTCPVMLKHIPVDVKAQFKAWCAKRGVTMQAQIIFLMRQAIQSDKPYMPINPRVTKKHDPSM